MFIRRLLHTVHRVLEVYSVALLFITHSYNTHYMLTLSYYFYTPTYSPIIHIHIGLYMPSVYDMWARKRPGT